MQRGKRAAYNTMANILLQIVSLVCGLILPRLILTYFGSSYNGIVSAVSQFLSIVALLRSGVMGASQVALYKSLAQKDMDQTSAIVRATEKFMRKVAFIFVAFIVVFSCVYPLLIQNEFEWLFTASLVLITSASTFVQYYFGISYQVLLQADQHKYLLSLIEAATVVLNTVLAAILIKLGFSIHIVKLGSAVAFSLSPIFLNIYAKHHYKLRRNVEPDFASISQRWDAFGHQVASFVHNNTDVVLLTLFSNTKEVSVYTVYYLVGHALRKIVYTISTSVEAAFGNMLANSETSTVQRNLNLYELMIHLLSTILYGAGLMLITPFVGVYTRGVTDANYIRPAFACLVIFSEMIYAMREPYYSLIAAAGHFKQTKLYSYLEAGINLVLSLCLVSKLGLEGLVLGTLIATLYMYITYALYSTKNIAGRKAFIFIKRLIVTGLCMALIAVLCSLIPMGEISGYFAWIIYAVKCTLVVLAVTFAVNMAFYGSQMKALFMKLKGIASSLLHR